MKTLERVVYLVCADPGVTQQLVAGLMAADGNYQLPLATSVAQARRRFARATPTVVLLDETAVGPAERAPAALRSPLESASAALSEFAPVVVLAAPERQGELACPMAEGSVDFVARVGDFVPVAVGMLERRVRLAEQAEAATVRAHAEPDADFGETLRHEVNNPLTGILGNAELLLAEARKRNGLQASPMALERLQTIAELAVRLRETIRRISNARESRQDQVRSA